ncbi:aldo/keto reductase [Leekyejoonella antrihumi]|uniref:aldo/keto reductase n=1 Tax=Leekyejoonella antrihumi TaxID=1660198 RepID=UPI002482C7C6|nr:aldo/keto reductase [Leekyejoonella antrihumi]
MIQSRLNSSRLPGKALMSIGGMPLVELVARRASRSGHEVVVATSNEHYDSLIANHLARVKIPVVRGPLDDVLARFVLATSDLAPTDRVVRLTGDNPVADADLVDELLAAMDASGHAYGRVDIDQVPEGLGAEGFSVQALRDAAATTQDAYDREHVTPWLRRTLGELLFVPAKNPGEPTRYRCTVDTLSDFDRACLLFDSTTDAVRVPWAELMDRIVRDARVDGPTVPSRGQGHLRQSRLVLGTDQFSGQAAPSADQVRAILAAAVERGVSHVEVGRTQELAERRLHAGVEPQLTRRLKVISRLAPLTEGAAALRVETSLERTFAELGRREAAAALLPTLADACRDRGAGWARLRAYQGDGIVGLVGVCLQRTAELPMALELEGLDYLTLPFNVLSGGLGDHVEALIERGIVLSTHSTFAGGALLDPTAEGAKTLESLSAELGRADVADLCLSYVLGHGVVTSVTLGATNTEQLRQDLTLMAAEPLPADQIAQVDHRMAEAGR